MILNKQMTDLNHVNIHFPEAVPQQSGMKQTCAVVFLFYSKELKRRGSVA